MITIRLPLQAAALAAVACLTVSLADTSPAHAQQKELKIGFVGVTSGPAAAWGRARVPLVRDEEITPLERLALFADCGNGISYTLPIDGYLFVNVDLVISLFRAPVGEWICLDAETVVGPSGRGLARSTLYDVDGEIGSASQTLFVSPR